MRPIFSWAVLHYGSFNPQILRLSCSQYPILCFDVPTYSVHVNAGAHTTFFCAVLASALSPSAQLGPLIPQVSEFTIGKRSLVSLLPRFFLRYHILGPFGMLRALISARCQWSTVHLRFFRTHFHLTDSLPSWLCLADLSSSIFGPLKGLSP